MRVTLNEIAKAAGVSRGTVDRALNNRGRIHPEVAEKIRRIARDMGYTTNVNARALALSSKPRKIGVILQLVDTPFVKTVQEGIETAARELRQIGFSLDIILIEGLDRGECVLGVIRTGHRLDHLLVIVQGAVILPLVPGDHSQLDQGPGRVIVVGSIGFEGLEGPYGIIFVPDGYIGAAEFIKGFAVVRGARGSVRVPWLRSTRPPRQP